MELIRKAKLLQYQPPMWEKIAQDFSTLPANHFSEALIWYPENCIGG